MDEFRKKQTNPYSSQPNTNPKPNTNPAAEPVSSAPDFSPSNPVQPSMTPTPPEPQTSWQPEPQSHAVPEPAQDPAGQSFFEPVPPQQEAATDDDKAYDFLDASMQDNFFDDSAAPEGETEVASSEPEPVASPTPTETATQAPITQDKKSDKKMIAAALAFSGILLLAASVGGTWFYQQKRLASADNDKENVSSSSTASSGGVQTIDLFGDNDEEGEVAGTQDAAFSQSIFPGQTGANDDKILFEAFIDTDDLPALEAAWINWGGSPGNLDQKSAVQSEGLEKNKDGEVTVVIIEADASKFEKGSSYLFQISVRDETGAVHRSGYAVVTIPGTPDPNKQSSQNNNRQSNQNNNQPSNSTGNPTANPFELGL